MTESETGTQTRPNRPSQGEPSQLPESAPAKQEGSDVTLTIVSPFVENFDAEVDGELHRVRRGGSNFPADVAQELVKAATRSGIQLRTTKREGD